MNIHIIGINYWPEETGIALLTTDRAQYLAERGHRVTMCTAVPYYPQWRPDPAYRRRWLARERRADVAILRCPLYVPSRVTPVRRMLHEGSFIAAAFVRSLFSRRPDLLLIVSPPLGLAVIGALLGRIWRVPYVFDVADLQPDVAVDLGMVRRGRLARGLYALERFAYEHAVIVSTLTEAMRSRIVAKGVDREKTALFGLWADVDVGGLGPAPGHAEIRQELGLGGAFVALHIGNMGVKQGLEVILAAAERTRADPDLLYVLVGDGATRASLEARAHARALKNVRMIPLLDRARFRRLLAASDACLVTQRRSVADIVFPSKVVTLLAAGKPVVASVAAASEVARVISESGAGPVVEPEDASALVAAIERLRASAGLRTEQGESGRSYARRHWDRATTLAHFTTTLETVLDGTRRDGL